ncbi:TIGR03085 family metal-binding protein [Actinoplanes sp. TRM 88003]|uniref:TIGR03085 family metal-binding protein n=1 Tax=Paractinoplanes aksuensis TaxID=2939490 RepID=A0ABT1E2J9_9ACTN|nr:TIGR03085 family metal-binding protein [Actinoplanes aksuensis]MCO8277366.1 TIGR03085 family metal-binding protein [Actinoplanes aksuensis]
MTAYAQRERRLLADLLLRLGPDEPTLCEGWATRDLAAHLVVRDRRPDAAAGAMIRPLQAYGERVRQQKASQPYAEVVSEVRRPPWWSPVSNPLVDEPANTIEFFVHHEDARRAQPGWVPRELDPGFEAALWRNVKLTGKLVLRRTGVAVEVKAPGYGSFTVGDHPATTLTGPPGELALFLTGRREHARVAIEGDGLGDAKLGL